MTTVDLTERVDLTGAGEKRSRWGDWSLIGISGGATVLMVVTFGLIVWKIVDQANPAVGKFGLGFLSGSTWNAVNDQYGARDFIFGTAITSLFALIIATPIAIAIGLFLSDLAPKGLRSPVGAMVETLAGVPSVLIGLWGIIVLGPVVRDDIAPALATVLDGRHSSPSLRSATPERASCPP